ncbi:expressed unknown protein [Seminavis robusta]|uniref:Uncharacterized protein n=1 Tax=Seminavis robusta TaxID=568900 RepID=A0A9N8E3S9_9STRA|nr:expressed unknown protein [Seminavis robusta]|eukprot:Sro515_g158300.1 n/a (495) ;mRNA; f:31269-32753
MLVNGRDDVFTVLHRSGASVDFIADCITNDADYPMIRVPDSLTNPKNYNISKNAKLQAIVLDYRAEEVVFSKMRSQMVAKMVLCDGSFTCWKAVTNSSLSFQVEAGEDNQQGIPVGSVLTIEDYNWMHLSKDDPHVFRRCMLINRCSFIDPPSVEQGAASKNGSPLGCKNGSSFYLDSDSDSVSSEPNSYYSSFVPAILDTVKLKGDVVFTCACCLYDPKTNEAFVYNESATKHQLQSGDPCQVTWNRADFKRVFDLLLKPEEGDDDASNTSDSKACGCIGRYGFDVCCLKSFDILEMQWDSIYQSIICKMAEDDIITPNFEDLSEGKKRWVVYTWFATNVFMLRNRRKLPSCLETIVKKVFANKDPTEEYTGYKVFPSAGEKRSTDCCEERAVKKAHLGLEVRKKQLTSATEPIDVDAVKVKDERRMVARKKNAYYCMSPPPTPPVAKQSPFEIFVEEVQKACSSDTVDKDGSWKKAWAVARMCANAPGSVDV